MEKEMATKIIVDLYEHVKNNQGFDYEGYLCMKVLDVIEKVEKETISQEKEKMIEEIKKLKVKVDYSLPTIDYHWSDHDIDNAKNEGIEMVINLLQNK